MGDAIDDEYELQNGGIVDSQEPLTAEGHRKDDAEKGEEVQVKNFKKDIRSIFLSIFNLMNAILGSGILGLAEALMNLGVILFYVLLLMTACLASYTISMLLRTSNVCGEKSYEGMAFKAFGIKGKVATSIMIVLHCLGAMCSYVFIIKVELPEVIRVFAGYENVPDDSIPYFLTGEFLMLMVVVLVIVPLASMKDIRFLGYSSAFGMTCMLLFTFTVVAKKFVIPCPLPVKNDTFMTATPHLTLNVTGEPEIDHHSHSENHVEQICEPELAKMNSKSAYAVPTMFFAFMCHASMLPIYQELRRPSIAKMQKVANISIFNVFVLYVLSATFGYFTFYNKVASELLLTYKEFDPSDPITIVARIMVIICVTLSVPLLHYPCRKTIITTVFPNQEFSWIRHIAVMVVTLIVTVIVVLFVPNIRDIFGIAGATSSASLLILFPCAFFIRLTDRTKFKEKYRIRRLIAMILFIVGLLFMIASVALIINDWVTKDSNDQ